MRLGVTWSAKDVQVGYSGGLSMRSALLLLPLLATASDAQPGRPAAVPEPLTGHLDVYGPLLIRDPAARPDDEGVRIPPGRYAGRIAKLTSNELVIELEAPGVTEVRVKLRRGRERFPHEGGRFSFPPARHNLPYTITGERLVLKTLARTTRGSRACTVNRWEEQCYDTITDDGEIVRYCRTVLVSDHGAEPTMRQQFVTNGDFELGFFEPSSSSVVARYFEGSDDRVDTDVTSLGDCR